MCENLLRRDEPARERRDAVPSSVLGKSGTTDLDALVKEYERSGFASLKSAGALLVASAGAWIGIEMARARHPLDLLANWATTAPLLDTNTTLGAELAVLSVIATLCVAMMIGARIDERSPANLPRLSRWSEAISDSLMMLSATSLVLAISQVAHEPTPGGSWVCVVVAGVALILVATTAPDQSSFARLRMALDARNARLGRTATANLKTWGVAGRPPWRWIVIGVAGYPLAALGGALVIASGLGVAIDWEVVVVHLGFWVFWTTPLTTVFGLAVWGLRAYGYRRLGSVVRLLLVAPSVWMLGAGWRAVTDAYTLGLWACGLFPPLALAALLPVLPRLRATNPFFALGWYWLPRPGRDDAAREPETGEGCPTREPPSSRDTSATPGWATVAVIGSALSLVTAGGLLQRFGGPKSPAP